MWGIFIGSLLFVLAITFHPAGIDWIMATIGMTVALAATARYAAHLLTPASYLRETVYDALGTEPTPIERPAV